MKKLQNIFTTIANCITPCLTILIGAGMIKAILTVLEVLNVLSNDSSTYVVLEFVADAGFYFLPIFVGFNAGKVFGVDANLSALMGAMLLAPEFVEYVNNGNKLTIFSLPITSTTYGSQIIPIILSVWLMSYLYKFCNKKINDNLESVLTPLIVILVMVPINFCLIGPLGVFIGNFFVKFVLSLKKAGPLGYGIVAVCVPLLVCVGLGGINVTIVLLLAASGVDPFFYFVCIVYNVVLGFVLLPVYLKNKEANLLAAIITVVIGGISEPAVFGYLIKDMKSLISLLIACFVSGVLAYYLNIHTYSVSSFSIFGIMSTISPNSSIVNSLIAVIITCLVGFIASYIIHNKSHE